MGCDGDKILSARDTLSERQHLRCELTSLYGALDIQEDIKEFAPKKDL